MGALRTPSPIQNPRRGIFGNYGIHISQLYGSGREKAIFKINPSPQGSLRRTSPKHISTEIVKNYLFRPYIYWREGEKSRPPPPPPTHPTQPTPSSNNPSFLASEESVAKCIKTRLLEDGPFGNVSNNVEEEAGNTAQNLILVCI